jgi:hypothetical protein
MSSVARNNSFLFFGFADVGRPESGEAPRNAPATCATPKLFAWLADGLTSKREQDRRGVYRPFGAFRSYCSSALDRATPAGA